VQRWLKFARYLPEFGVEPLIFVPENASYPLLEPELDQQVAAGLEIHKVPIWEIRNVYTKLMRKQTAGKSGIDGVFYLDSKQQSLKQRISLWIRSNLIFPDARMTWIRPCARAIKNYLKENEVDAIISTGPPHSCHLIALRVKQSFPQLKWIADFRDPWTNTEYFNRMPLTSWARKHHASLERKVLTTADHVLTVSWSWSEEFRAAGAKAISVITNGYDPSDFEQIIPEKTNKFVISHIGTLQDDRDPDEFWSLLANLVKEQEGFKERLEIRLVGLVAEGVKSSIAHHGLEKYTRYLGFTSHREALTHMKSSHILLLLINNDERNARGRLPAKLYEYMAAGSRIIVFGPQTGDIEKILGPSILLHSPENTAIKKLIVELLTKQEVQPVKYDHGTYKRKGLTRQMSELIKEVIVRV